MFLFREIDLTTCLRISVLWKSYSFGCCEITILRFDFWHFGSKSRTVVHSSRSFSRSRSRSNARNILRTTISTGIHLSFPTEIMRIEPEPYPWVGNLFDGSEVE